MEISEALALVSATRESVLVTLRRDGRPQLSNVLHHLGEDGLVRISTTADRAKFRNLARQPWAALHVNGETFFSYAVVEAEAELTAAAAEPDDVVVEELVELYRSIAGEHDDWDAYRRAMVEEGRAIVRLRPTRAYGAPGSGG